MDQSIEDDAEVPDDHEDYDLANFSHQDNDPFMHHPTTRFDQLGMDLAWAAVLQPSADSLNPAFPPPYCPSLSSAVSSAIISDLDLALDLEANHVCPSQKTSSSNVPCLNTDDHAKYNPPDSDMDVESSLDSAFAPEINFDNNDSMKGSTYGTHSFFLLPTAGVRHENSSGVSYDEHVMDDMALRNMDVFVNQDMCMNGFEPDVNNVAKRELAEDGMEMALSPVLSAYSWDSCMFSGSDT